VHESHTVHQRARGGETGRRVGVGRSVCADGHSPSPLCDAFPRRVFLAQVPPVSPKDPTTPYPSSVTSVTSVRCFSLAACFSPRCRRCRQRPGHCPSPSVTSVRCFPLACVSRPGAPVSPKTRPLPIPLCDLCDLCAMLSPSACFSPRGRRCPPTSFLTQRAGISLPVCAS
jgi:hypothetical protein